MGCNDPATVSDMLPDILGPDLTAVFVGTSKGDESVRRGHYYAGRGNKFWDLLGATGLVSAEHMSPERDAEVLTFGVGLTDLVHQRSASSDALLKPDDFDVIGFLAKIELHRPKVVAFNGGGAAQKVARHLGHGKPEEGPASWTIHGARTYRLPSSSGANATGGYRAKRARWEAFGDWVRAIH
jgi:double-stranded uracil-DNA glycosylase